MKKIRLISISSVMQILFIILPLLGVIFLDWNAFEMLFIYLSESAVFSFFALLKRRKIDEYLIQQKVIVSNARKNVIGFFGLALLFLFFYLVLLGMSSMRDAIQFPKFEFDLISMFKILSAPAIQNHEILYVIIGNTIGQTVLYVFFIKRHEFIEEKNSNPESIITKSILTVFIVICLSFPVFWIISVIGSIIDANNAKTINIVMALVMALVNNAGAIFRVLKIRSLQ